MAVRAVKDQKIRIPAKRTWTADPHTESQRARHPGSHPPLKHHINNRRSLLVPGRTTPRQMPVALPRLMIPQPIIEPVCGPGNLPAIEPQPVGLKGALMSSAAGEITLPESQMHTHIRQQVIHLIHITEAGRRFWGTSDLLCFWRLDTHAAVWSSEFRDDVVRSRL